MSHQSYSTSTDGRLDLGPVGAGVLREFDGRRRKRGRF